MNGSIIQFSNKKNGLCVKFMSKFLRNYRILFQRAVLFYIWILGSKLRCCFVFCALWLCQKILKYTWILAWPLVVVHIHGAKRGTEFFLPFPSHELPLHSILSCRHITVERWCKYAQTNLDGVLWGPVGQKDGSPYILLPAWDQYLLS